VKEKRYPLMPLRDVVVFPHMVVPLFVGRKSSVEALEQALANNSRLLLSTQKQSATNEPEGQDIYAIGVFARVLQMMRMANNTVKVLVEGESVAKIYAVRSEPDVGYMTASFVVHGVEESDHHTWSMKQIKQRFAEYVKQDRKLSSDVLRNIPEDKGILRFSYGIAANLAVSIEERQYLLERQSSKALTDSLVTLLDKEIELKTIDNTIRTQVKKQMDKNQRDYYLNEKIKAIHQELGKGEDTKADEMAVLAEQIDQSRVPKEVREKLHKELAKLKMMAPTAAEAGVIRNFIDTVLDVPWYKTTRVNANIAKARKVLDADHYGLEEVKERIIEYLAVQKRVKHMKSPILCLVGPPGVGKTSLGRSIAKATGRKYVRLSLGGVRDEAEIRGHRRTYIGAMPGRIIQRMTKAGVVNPLFLLDEVDKMAMDFRGDPASALLEVLDPEQNNSFNDHYLEFDYDLSRVMFVATANSMNIPEPLLDRMEIIRIPGYTEAEKLHIATEYLIPRQREKHGLQARECGLSSEAVQTIIRYYTREAEVRGLERDIAKVMRKVTLALEVGSKKRYRIDADDIAHYLEAAKYRYGQAEEDHQVGRVTGLAWTPVGGDLLVIESTLMPGKGKFMLTGQLGDVMRESSQAALSVVRSRSDALGVKPEDVEQRDIHIHVPEGAIPKDGPSAGIAMCTVLVSVFTGIKVRADVAMTGEITLRGEVLPIGGLKEKLLAAHRGGIKVVIIPEDNRKDLAKIPDNIRDEIDIIPVRWIDEVLELALTEKPQALALYRRPAQFKAGAQKGALH
jgi:ATP-dependent Lon protease